MASTKKEKHKLITDDMGQLSLISIGFILAGLYGLQYGYLSDKNHIVQSLLWGTLAVSIVTLIVALFINKQILESKMIEKIISRLEHFVVIIWVDIACLYWYLSKDDILFSFGKSISSFEIVYDVDSSLTFWYIFPLLLATFLCLILVNLPERVTLEKRLGGHNRRGYLLLVVLVISLCIMMVGQLLYGKIDFVSFLGALIALLVTWTNL